MMWTFAKIKSFIPDFVKQGSKRLILRVISVSYLSPKNLAIKLETEDSAAWPAIFIGTIHGLLYFDGTLAKKLLEGSIYGITRHETRWYVFQKIETDFGITGRLLSFCFKSNVIEKIRIEIDNLDPEVHQIDFVHDILHLTDTANNRILRYQLLNNRLTKLDPLYPAGRLNKGHESSNYVHLNSIYNLDGLSYVVFHNHTNKTGTNSQVAVLDEDGNLVKIQDTDFGCAHNFVIVDGQVIICDSQSRAAYFGDQIILQCAEFTRGVSVTNNNIIIGGSHIVDKVKRGDPSLVGKIYLIDRITHQVKDVMRLPGIGNIYEIRAIVDDDLGISFSGS